MPYLWHSAFRALSIMAVDLECCYAECRDFITIMLNVVAPQSIFATPQTKLWNSRRVHVRNFFRKTTALSCHRCLINTGVEEINNTWIVVRILPIRCLFVQMGFNWVTDKKSSSVLNYFQSLKGIYTQRDSLIKYWLKEELNNREFN